MRDAGGRELPAWSVDGGLKLMGSQGIASAVVSISTPGVYPGATPEPDGIARAKARELNELAARMACDHPGRFGFFATLPVLDPDGALDTTRAAYRLVRNGFVRRWPSIAIILSHSGGFVPYASHRLAMAITGDTQRPPFEVLDHFASFYFHTSPSGSPAALPSLLAFAKPGHVLFGSDWPYAPPIAVGWFTSQLGAHAGLDDAGHAAVDRGNAEVPFPNLARKEFP